MYEVHSGDGRSKNDSCCVVRTEWKLLQEMQGLIVKFTPAGI